MNKFLPSPMPPKNLKPEQIPQFVTVGFDDNERAEGMKWATDAFLKRKNPDGSKCSCAFYMASNGITEGESSDPPEAVKASWKFAIENGFEIGCHTHSHSDGANFSVDEWTFEMNKCIEALCAGINIPKNQIRGFRAPYLSYNENLHKAVKKMGFACDCSVQEGFQEDQDGTNFFFPYTITVDGGEIWEMPIQAVIVPPELRGECAERQSYFYQDDGKISGLDYNCFVPFQMTADEFIATLKHTLDLRLKGNRAPFSLGGHTGIYAEEYKSSPMITIPVSERRRAIEEFLDYALSKPEVYVVTPSKILEWMKDPKTL